MFNKARFTGITNQEDAYLTKFLVDEDLATSELAGRVQTVTKFKGYIVFNSEKPDTAPRKLLEISSLNIIGVGHR